MNGREGGREGERETGEREEGRKTEERALGEAPSSGEPSRGEGAGEGALPKVNIDERRLTRALARALCCAAAGSSGRCGCLSAVLNAFSSSSSSGSSVVRKEATGRPPYAAAAHGLAKSTLAPLSPPLPPASPLPPPLPPPDPPDPPTVVTEEGGDGGAAGRAVTQNNAAAEATMSSTQRAKHSQRGWPAQMKIEITLIYFSR